MYIWQYPCRLGYLRTLHFIQYEYWAKQQLKWSMDLSTVCRPVRSQGNTPDNETTGDAVRNRQAHQSRSIGSEHIESRAPRLYITFTSDWPSQHASPSIQRELVKGMTQPACGTIIPERHEKWIVGLRMGGCGNGKGV